MPEVCGHVCTGVPARVCVCVCLRTRMYVLRTSARAWMFLRVCEFIRISEKTY